MKKIVCKITAEDFEYLESRVKPLMVDEEFLKKGVQNIVKDTIWLDEKQAVRFIYILL